MFKLPPAFLDAPESLRICNAATTDEELKLANEVRKEYLITGPNAPYQGAPYMVDVCRAFRLAQDAQIYIEIGTQDKGNLAWLARTRLKKGATIIDIDMLDYPESDIKIRRELEKDFDYHAVRGNCLSDQVLARVEKILDGRRADVIFGDSHYTYSHTMTEFTLYHRLVKRGGFLMFHDAEWPGGDVAAGGEFAKKGKGLAVQHLDRFYPAWMVYGKDRPLYRPVPIPNDPPHWGVLAVFPL